MKERKEKTVPVPVKVVRALHKWYENTCCDWAACDALFGEIQLCDLPKVDAPKWDEQVLDILGPSWRCIPRWLGATGSCFVHESLPNYPFRVKPGGDVRRVAESLEVLMGNDPAPKVP